MRYPKLEHLFVDHIPEVIEPGVLYISMNYATAAHQCCCGCGNEVITPITPTDWSLIFDGESISLSPSIGSWTLPCRAHYFIDRGRVIEAPPWSERQVAAERARGRRRQGELLRAAGADPESCHWPGGTGVYARGRLANHPALAYGLVTVWPSRPGGASNFREHPQIFCSPSFRSPRLTPIKAVAARFVGAAAIAPQGWFTNAGEVRAVMRFIHSADWQIGKVFKQFGPKEETLRRARLAAVERLGQLAVAHGARHVLVAGDIYDSEAPSAVTLRAPVERMKGFADLRWHLLPGNHDPHRPEGVWDRLAQAGLPSNIHLHLDPTPFALEEGAVLLPAPLTRNSDADDITAWMDSAPTPAGALRIGLAHGSITNFGSEGEATNPIDPGALRAPASTISRLVIGIAPCRSARPPGMRARPSQIAAAARSRARPCW